MKTERFPVGPDLTKEPDIFFVTRKWPPATGGMETWSYRLSEELQKLATVEVVALPGKADGMPPGKTGLLLFPFTVARAWLKRKTRPKILQIGDLAMWPIGLLARRHTRVFIAAHGTDAGYHRRESGKGRLYGLYLKLGALLMRQATVIANSRATRNVARETGWRNIKIVLLGTDFRPPPTMPKTSLQVLFAGRLIPMKGCGWFVREVLPLLPEEIGLDIAGTTWDIREAELVNNARVRHLGNLDPGQLAEAYSAALCVIIPNIDVPSGEFEGFGLVAPEAAASGGIVLASRRDGLADAVIDKQTGFLLPSGDAQVWRDKIIEIRNWSKIERRVFLDQSQMIAAQRFAWERVAREILAEYTSEGSI